MTAEESAAIREMRNAVGELTDKVSEIDKRQAVSDERRQGERTEMLGAISRSEQAFRELTTRLDRERDDERKPWSMTQWAGLGTVVTGLFAGLAGIVSAWTGHPPPEPVPPPVVVAPAPHPSGPEPTP